MRFTDLTTSLATAILAAFAIMGPFGSLSAGQTSESPLELVRRTVQSEVAASNGNAKVMFMDRKETPRGSQTKLMVETHEAIAGLVIANNDKPLTPEQRQAEEARLSGLARNPEALQKKQRSEKEDTERITRIMKALPDAFLYEADGTVAGSQEVGKAGAQLIRLKFHPNPKYSPPTHVEQVLTGMQGYLLIDGDQHRIAKIDGTLNKEVSFGWGIFGHLDRGGHFLVEQAQVLEGDWEITRMSLSFTGKELLFKSIHVKSDEVFSKFRPVPSSLSFSQGVDLLKKQEAELDENREGTATDNSKYR
jgi:hypothetical protein